MANRQIIPLNRVVKSHVNSLDNGTGYEAGTAYEAGTLVTYNGNSYTAIVDIEDTDTDAPDEAPDKWALTPDAFTSYASDPSLAGRVSDLEAFDAAIPDGYLFIERRGLSKTYENKTYSEILDDISAELLAVANAMEDDEFMLPSSIVMANNFTAFIRPTRIFNTSLNANIIFSIVSSSQTYLILWSGIAYSGTGTSILQHVTISNAGVISFTDETGNSAGASKECAVYYDVYKKIKSE